MNDWSPRTRAVAAGRPTEPGEPLNTPIVATSTYVAGGEFTYARESGTPTWVALEEAVGALEGGRATAFASGIGAVAAVFELFPIGAQVAVPTFSYSGTRALLERAMKQGRFHVRELDPEDAAAWQAAATEVDVLWIESPTNPTLHLIDIAPLTGRRARVVVDNTFATPLGQQPLALGADIVVHSATKLIGGHSDLLLGLTIAADETLAQELRDARTRNGATPGALEAWLALRGLRTLPVRLAEQSKTAALLAERLSAHEAVTKVSYPGQGLMIAFELSDAQFAGRFIAALELIVHATSLGGVESLVERRAMYAGDVHVPPGLIRFSVGLEDPEDLWRDLSKALPSDPVMNYANLFRLDGKRAVVLGAGSGIGRESARALAAHGAEVISADRDLAAAKETGGQAYEIDLFEPGAAERAAKELGELDIVVLTAAMNVRKRLLDYTREEFDRVLALNLGASFDVVRAFGAGMVERGRGSIIGFSSIRGTTVEPGQGPYAATKAGLVQLFRTAAAEFGPAGVRVNAIAPGVVETPLTAQIKASPDWYAAYADKSALGRWARPEELAGAVVYLASDAASFVTGSVLAVDGGWTAVDGRYTPPE